MLTSGWWDDGNDHRGDWAVAFGAFRSYDRRSRLGGWLGRISVPIGSASAVGQDLITVTDILPDGDNQWQWHHLALALSFGLSPLAVQGPTLHEAA